MTLQYTDGQRWASNTQQRVRRSLDACRCDAVYVQQKLELYSLFSSFPVMTLFILELLSLVDSVISDVTSPPFMRVCVKHDASKEKLIGHKQFELPQKRFKVYCS